MVTALVVGQRYNSEVHNWPEGSNYNYRDNTHELLITYSGATPTEIAQVQSAPVKFALTTHNGVLFLLYRFGDNQWSDAPYSYWRVPENERYAPPAVIGDARAIIQVLLIEASTGVLLAIRAVSLSPHFTRALHRAIQDQVSHPELATQYDLAISDVYRKYPDTKDMAAAAAARCTGGE